MKTLTEQYIIKSRSGVYQDTSENRRKHRVGQHYGEAKKEGEEGNASKREQREARLASYKKNLDTISEAIKEGKIDPSKKAAAEALKAKLEGKITKLEARLNKKGQQKTEEPKPEAKKKPWANKGVGMPKSDGKKLFEGLTKEQQKDLTDKYKEESESMLRQENMTPELVIGAIEEFIGENLYESDDVMDLSEELKVSKNEAQAIIRHTLDLEMKRLEGLQKEFEKKSDVVGEPSWDKQEAFFKKGTDEYELLDNLDHYHRRKDPFYQKEMQKIFEKKFPNIDEWRLTTPGTGRAEIRAMVDGKEVASINLNDAGEKSTIPMLQTFMDKCQKAEKKKEDSGSSEKGLVHVIGESSSRFASKKGLVFADISKRAKEDFDRYSGIRTEQAVEFMNKVIDETGFNGRAELFYSGNAGWALYDEDDEPVGTLLYEGNKYGLEDATWGDGWKWRGKGNDSEISNKIRGLVPKINVRPEKPRM